MTVDEAISVLRSAITYIDYCTQCDDPDPKCKTNGDECAIALNTLVKNLRPKRLYKPASSMLNLKKPLDNPHLDFEDSDTSSKE